MLDLPEVEGTFASGMSADGSVVVRRRGHDRCPDLARRRRAGSRHTRLGAHAVARRHDDRGVVGFVSATVVEPRPAGVSESRALRWEETGLGVLPTAEGLLDGEAVDVSRAGAIVVGRCGDEFERDGVAARRSVAVVSEGNRGRTLPVVDGAASTRGRFFSDEGRVVVGNWYSVVETGVFVSSQATGTIRSRDLLISSGHGSEISDLSLEGVAGVSSDGHARHRRHRPRRRAPTVRVPKPNCRARGGRRVLRPARCGIPRDQLPLAGARRRKRTRDSWRDRTLRPGQRRVAWHRRLGADALPTVSALAREPVPTR